MTTTNVVSAPSATPLHAQTQTPKLRTFASLGAELGNLVDSKNASYGNSFDKCGEFLRLLYPLGVTPSDYTNALALVRIFDKCVRIATNPTALGEEPFKDIAGYGLLGWRRALSPRLRPAPNCNACWDYWEDNEKSCSKCGKVFDGASG